MTKHPTALISALAAAALITGCSESRPLAAPFTGTWHQVAGTAGGSTPNDTRRVGFVAFGAERVTTSMTGGEHSVLAISENLSDPGLRAGRLRLEDGSEMFISAGQGYVDLALADGRLLAPSTWLDVHWIRAGGRETTMRLWSDEALAAVDLAKRTPPRVVVAAAPALQEAPRSSEGNPRDQRFIDNAAASGEQVLTQAARELVSARTGGASESRLAGILARISITERLELLALMTAARDGQNGALADADRLQTGLTHFDQAFGEWLPASP